VNVTQPAFVFAEKKLWPGEGSGNAKKHGNIQKFIFYEVED